MVHSRRIFPSLLTISVLREMTVLFCLSLGSLLSLILLGRILQLRNLFMGLDLGIADLLLLFLYLSPFFLLMLVPVACMLSVFLTLLRMSSDRELIALKAGGIGFQRLLPPVVAFSVLCSLLTLGVSLYTLAWGMDNFRTSVVEYAKTRTKLALQPGIFNTDIPGLTVFASRVDMENGELMDVFIEDRTEGDRRAVVYAPKGLIQSNPEQGRIVFTFKNGKIYRHSGDESTVLSFSDYRIRLNLSDVLRGFDARGNKPKEMSWSKLMRLKDDPQAKIKDDGNYHRKILVEIQKRWALPFACCVLGIFAFPLALLFEGLERQFGLILVLGCFLVYYVMLSLGLSLGETGTLSPVVGLWLPNVVFMLAGILGIRIVARERSLQLVDRFRRNMEIILKVFRKWRPSSSSI